MKSEVDPLIRARHVKSDILISRDAMWFANFYFIQQLNTLRADMY
jgi:hypothetical protein